MSSPGNEPPYQPPTFGSPPAPPPTPYAPQGYPPNAYGTGYAAVNPYESRSTTILVLGILGLVLCQVLGIVAWVMGSNLRKEALAAGYPEPGQAKAGRICGIIATALLALFAGFFVLLLIIGAANSN
jgi:cytosine/uracil/thiamine/allantoin permease